MKFYQIRAMCGSGVYRYLLWVSYDGARFVSITNKSISYNVLGFLKTLVRGTFPDVGKQLKMSQSSRFVSCSNTSYPSNDCKKGSVDVI